MDEPQQQPPQAPAQEPKSIILVEDDPALAEIYKTRLEGQGYRCFVAYNGIIALYFIQKDTPDLVMLDLMIPDLSGAEVLATMRRSSWGKDIPVYVISNLSEAQAPKGLRELGIVGYSVKANLSYGEVDQIANSILRHESKPQAA
jgi:DNA-binding response OmpR family regulator